MRLIDMHCDTIFLMMREENVNLRSNQLCIDLEKMNRAGSMAQFFACFIHMGKIAGEDRFTKGYQNALEMIARGKKEFSENADQISLVTNYEEFMKNTNAGKMSAFLTIEEGGIIGNDMRRLERLYDEGIRLMTLLWNEENCIGYPNSRDAEIMNKGLKPFGIETVERMNELGMIIDVSHLSDGGFWDVLKHSKKPVVASHSNSRSVYDHSRSLTDDQFRAVCQTGGVVGLNFYSGFVGEKPTMDQLLRHLEYFLELGGEKHVALGGDLDGCDETVEGIGGIQDVPKLWVALKNRGYSDGLLDDIFWTNWLRLF